MHLSCKTVRTSPSQTVAFRRPLTNASRPPHHKQDPNKLSHSLEETIQQHPPPPTTATDQIPPAISYNLHVQPQNTNQQCRRHPLQQPDRPPTNPSLSLCCDFHSTHCSSLPDERWQTTSTPCFVQIDCYYRRSYRREIPTSGDVADFCCCRCRSCCRSRTAGVSLCDGSRWRLCGWRGGGV